MRPMGPTLSRSGKQQLALAVSAGGPPVFSHRIVKGENKSQLAEQGRVRPHRDAPPGDRSPTERGPWLYPRADCLTPPATETEPGSLSCQVSCAEQSDQMASHLIIH